MGKRRFWHDGLAEFVPYPAHRRWLCTEDDGAEAFADWARYILAVFHDFGKGRDHVRTVSSQGRKAQESTISTVAAMPCHFTILHFTSMATG
jgi:hypothetical protein